MCSASKDAAANVRAQLVCGEMSAVAPATGDSHEDVPALPDAV